MALKSAPNANTPTTSSATPAEELGTLLTNDMRAVNTLIIERMDSHVPLVKQLASYLIASGGKRVRPLLTLAATSLYNGEMPRAHLLAACVEFIHTATLLHDDVVDESDERRGQKAANLIFGNQASVLVGDFLFSRSFQMMVEDGNLEILRILSEASAVIAQGEVLQLTTANNLETTMEQYMEVIQAKTAALFAAACEVGPVIAGQDKETCAALASFGNNLGIAFQIADDVLDYSAKREKLGKTIGDDFREGKMTAPVLFSLENANESEKAFWNRTIAERDQSEGDLQTALEIFSRHDTLEKSITLAKSYAEKAVQDLKIAPNTPLKSLMESLALYTVTREF